MKVVLDINNFWSPSGGGVRRYHLQKMDYYQNKQNDYKLVFLMQDKCNRTEEISPTLTIEHVKSMKVPGNWWEYRFIYSAKQIKPYIEKFNADIVEVGSPYILPAAVSKACQGLTKKPVLTAFWHADFPVTYIRRTFGRINGMLGRKLESLAWSYARKQFKNYQGIQVSCKETMERMKKRGLSNLHLLPLGIDSGLFNPSCKDDSIVEELKAGSPNRLTMFFPHRFCKEKGVSLLLDAYPIISENLGLEPALVFAGAGNRISLVKEAVKKYKHIKYVGFIKNTEDMAKWSASCEMGFALSGWETFGFSILEGMSCGECLIGATTGAAAEHIKESGGGITLSEMSPAALAQAVCRVASDKEKMRIFAANGRAYAEHFSWDSCFEKQMEYYAELLGG